MANNEKPRKTDRVIVNVLNQGSVPHVILGAAYNFQLMYWQYEDLKKSGYDVELIKNISLDERIKHDVSISGKVQKDEGVEEQEKGTVSNEEETPVEDEQPEEDFEDEEFDDIDDDLSDDVEEESDDESEEDNFDDDEDLDPEVLEVMYKYEDLTIDEISEISFNELRSDSSTLGVLARGDKKVDVVRKIFEFVN